MNAPLTFTAAQLARAFKRDKRTILLTLRDVPAVTVQTRGGEAKAWPVHALPAAWQQQLTIEARRHGCRDAAHLLQTSAERWEPRNAEDKIIPLSQIAQHWIDKASKLRDALREPLARQHELKRPELRELGLKEYARIFGYSVAGRHWDRLFDRTVKERDRGAEDLTRLEIYLDAPAFAQHTPKPSRDKARFTHHALDHIFEDVTKRAERTPAERAGDRAWLLHEAFTHYEGLCRDHPSDQRAIKESLRDYLHSAAPGLARTPKALRRYFDRKLAQWITGGRTIDALLDMRPDNSGNHRRPDFSADERKIRDLAIQLDGNESRAHQMLRERGELSPEFIAYYSYDPRADKSRVPRTVRQAITPAVNLTLPLRHSSRALNLAGPWTDRDWSDVLPGDWFTADDVTWNHLFKTRRPDGSWDVRRGECLLMADGKSDFAILPYLIAGPYNSEHTVCLIAGTHDRVGLPRKGFIFERGRWSGKLNKSIGADAILPGETVKAFSRAMPGLKIHRTWTPRGKPIEGVFHHLQDRMRCIFGFVGFNEQVEKREDIQKLITRARRGDEEALAQFLTQDQWMEKIVGELNDFNHSPGNGKRLSGESPAEAWNRTLREHPLPKLSSETRYLLATHCVQARITRQGIVLTIRGHRRCYADRQTGALLANGVDRVLAFYNLEQPELLTVSNLQRTQFFTVKALALPAMSATREQLAEVAAAKRAHLAPARAIFGDIKPAVVSTITRDDAHDEADKELGRFHNAAVEQHEAEECTEVKMKSRIRALCDELGEPHPDFETSRVPLPRMLDAKERKLAKHRRRNQIHVA